MKRKLTALVLMAASYVILLPITSAAYSPGDKNTSLTGFPIENTVLQQKRGRGNRNSRYWENRGRRRNGTWNGYRNYGQYRRTQVGNRRYRTVRRYVWQDGRRVSVWRRIFY